MYSKQDPYVITLQPNSKVLICTCGLSQTPPYCDNAHLGNSDKQPMLVDNPGKGKKLQWICGCNKSAEMPYCDGNHNPRNKMSVWQSIKLILQDLRKGNFPRHEP